MRKRQQGFLLIELALAMLFISVALVGLLDAFRSSLRAQNHNDRRTQAFLLLERKIQDLEQPGALGAGVKEGGFEDESSFKWETEIAETEVPDLYRARITVSWRDEAQSVTVYLLERK